MQRLNQLVLMKEAVASGPDTERRKSHEMQGLSFHPNNQSEHQKQLAHACNNYS